MGENTPQIEQPITPESTLESRHNSAINKLLIRSGQIAEGYIDSRVKDNKLFIKDMSLVAGGMLIGLGIWQVLAGGHIPNIFEAINIFHLPGYNEMGQMITDTDADVKIIGGLSTTLTTLDSYRPKPQQPGKVDYHLIKAYAMNYLNKLSIRNSHNEQ